MRNFYFVLIPLLYLISSEGNSQCLTPVNFQLQKSIPSPAPLFNHDMTARRDSSPVKPYLYIAGMEQGLIIYNISSLTSPTLVSTIPTSSLGNLNVNSITQSGNYLFLSLGSIFNATVDPSSMAIVDVSNPNLPVVKSIYSYAAPSGVASIAIEGNYAFLAAMQNGIIVLDISNKSNPVFVSQFKPSVHFPFVAPTTLQTGQINARSMVIKNSIIYLCYDLGGFRVINATVKTNLKETGQYQNYANLPKGNYFNNLILNDTLVYAAEDYCGMEILNVKDTSNITQVSWWNPWKCQSASNVWNNSPGHANEIVFDTTCKMVFMSAGRSDVMAVSVVNPLLPDSCSQYGIKTDSNCTWGIGRYQNQIYACYITTWPWVLQPFIASWGGVKILTYSNLCSTGINELVIKKQLAIYPNPASEELNIDYSFKEKTELTVFDPDGKVCIKKECSPGEKFVKINIRNLAEGVYFVKLNSGEGYSASKFIVLRN